MAGVLSGFSFVIATTIQQLKNCCNNESTVKSTDFWLLVWKKWCFEKGIAKEIKITSRSSLTKIASLFNGRLHKILTIVFKSLFVSTYPGYLKELFVLRHSSYALRGKNVLTLPTENNKLRTWGHPRYQAAKMWNSLPDSMRTMTSFKDCKTAIKKKKMDFWW